MTTGEKALTSVILLLISPLAVVWRGYVLSILWHWFVVPTFGLPPLGIAATIGLAVVAHAFVNPSTSDAEDDRSFEWKIGAALGKVILVPPILLLSGYVVTWFM